MAQIVNAVAGLELTCVAQLPGQAEKTVHIVASRQPGERRAGLRPPS
jgi:hypothetical protein